MPPQPQRAEFLAFVKKAVAPHGHREIHVVLDNLSTHTTPDVQQWLAAHPHVHFHFTPKGSSWMNQIVRHASRMSAVTCIEGGAA